MLRRRPRAAAAGRVRLTAPACAELGAAKLTTAAARNCFLTGALIKDQYDARYRQTKYVLCGHTLAGGELPLTLRVARRRRHS